MSEKDLQGRHLYWVGSRFSDLNGFENAVYGSITLYGTTHGNHISFCDTYKDRFDNNVITEELNNKLRSAILSTAEKDPAAVFYFYNPKWKYDMGGLESVADRLLAQNTKSDYEFYSSKIKVFEYFSDKISMLESYAFDKDGCTFNSFVEKLGAHKDGYMVVAEKSDGGYGTLIVDGHNAEKFNQSLKADRFLVSRYQKNNIPVNIHAVIYAEKVILLPASVQLQRREDDRLIYKGADYIAFRTISDQLKSEFYAQALKLCEIMRADGYRGIVGIDAIMFDGKVAVVEVNTRFQGSSAILNSGLIDNGFASLQELNLKAFLQDAPDKNATKINPDLEIGYSCYSFSNVSPSEHADHILRCAADEKFVCRIDSDGYEAGTKTKQGIYKFRLCFSRNICALNPDGGIWLHENICEPVSDIYEKVCKVDPLALKITLLTQGVKIEPAAKQYLVSTKGGIREGNNNAVDILIRGMVINAPCDVDFISFTPYSIKIDGENRLGLYYYDRFIDYVTLYPLDPLSGKRTKSGRYYADIAYLSTDRLRVHMTNKCVYKKHGKSCQFCNINTEDTGIIPMEDICEVLDDYIQNAHELKHFLVGGQSAEENTEKTRVVDIIKAIRKRSDKKIYAMTLPFSSATVKEMKDAGMTELACNMEVFDDELARKYMPGKGVIPRKTYLKILNSAAELYGFDKDSVRSAMIIGLESRESFFDGLVALLQNGVQPIVSVFRPLPCTELEALMMPPADYLYDVFIQAEKLCDSYGFRLGPSCINCQNNTLSLPKNISDGYLG